MLASEAGAGLCQAAYLLTLALLVSEKALNFESENWGDKNLRPTYQLLHGLCLMPDLGG